MSESFFEKLKKGMRTEEEIKEKPSFAPSSAKASADKKATEGKEEKPKNKSKKTKEFKIETKPIELEAEKTEKPEEKLETARQGFAWQSLGGQEGQLAIDVYQTENELVIQSAIAGVKPEDLDILIEGDVLTIRGNRQKPFNEKSDYFIQECYWGPFSREVILPVEIDPGRVEALMNEGILTIKLPKIEREKKRKITVKR